MEKHEHVADPNVIDEVLKLLFHKAYQHLINRNGGMMNRGMMVPQNQKQTSQLIFSWEFLRVRH
jgi:hypothetical protein